MCFSGVLLGEGERKRGREEEREGEREGGRKRGREEKIIVSPLYHNPHFTRSWVLTTSNTSIGCLLSLVLSL